MDKLVKELMERELMKQQILTLQEEVALHRKQIEAQHKVIEGIVDLFNNLNKLGGKDA